MAELYANRFVTTIVGSIDGVTDPVSVTLTAAPPADLATGNWRAIVEDERFLVTSVAGAVVTMSRAQEGSTIAAHAAGKTFVHNLTRASLLNFARKDAANTFAADQSLDHAAATESGRKLVLPPRPDAVSTVGAWNMFVINGGTDQHDVGLTWDYNGYHIGRVVDGEHTARMLLESRWVGAGNPATMRGLFEWNLDIDVNTTNPPATVRPWAYYYDMDNRVTNAAVGVSGTEVPGSRFSVYGKLGVGTSSAGTWLRVRPTVASADNGLSIELPASYTGPAMYGSLNDVEKWRIYADGSFSQAAGSTISAGAGLFFTYTGYALIQPVPGAALIIGLDTDTAAVDLRRSLTFWDGKNIAVGSTAGTKIGTAITQKLGFFGATPVVPPAAYTQTYATADRTLGAYTSDPESSAYTGAADGEAKLVDLNALRVAYETLRVLTEDLAAFVNAHVDDMQAYGLLQ